MKMMKYTAVQFLAAIVVADAQTDAIIEKSVEGPALYDSAGEKVSNFIFLEVEDMRWSD